MFKLNQKDIIKQVIYSIKSVPTRTTVALVAVDMLYVRDVMQLRVSRNSLCRPRCVYSLQDTVSWRDSLTCSFLTGYEPSIRAFHALIDVFLSGIVGQLKQLSPRLTFPPSVLIQTLKVLVGPCRVGIYLCLLLKINCCVESK